MKIGIDIGTTNCTVSRIDIKSGAERTISPVPSIGFWQNGKMVFGDEASRELSGGKADIYPLKDVKMFLGDQSGLNICGNRVSAVDVICMLLKYLYIDIFGGNSTGEVAELVVATPVFSSQAHRKDLLEACHQAGFVNVKLVYEPTAALLGSNYSKTSQSDRDTVLVIDWGGGTLDITVVQKTKSQFQELAVGGDNFAMGGSMIDQEITRQILNDHPSIKRAVEQIEGGFDRLTNEIEIAKIDMLSGLFEEDELISPAWLNHIGFIDIPYNIVSSVINEFSKKALDIIVDTLKKAGIRSDTVTHILYAGGVCKSDMVKQHIRQNFPYAQEVPDSNPQALTGVGNARLARYGYDIKLSTNFGLKQCDGHFCILLDQGQQVAANRYRQAEFLVTDVRAPEALFDFGIQSSKMGWAPLEIQSKGFIPMKQVFLPVGNNRSKEPECDIIILFVGLANDLTVTVYLKAKISYESRQISISGIPLAIDIRWSE